MRLVRIFVSRSGLLGTLAGAVRRPGLLLAVALLGGVATTGATGCAPPAGSQQQGAAPGAATSQQRTSRPNVLFIVVDDLGWKDLGTFGSDFYETPHVDRLARRGMTFTSAYAAGPVCSPTRAAIQTGRHPARLRITDWIPGRSDKPSQPLLQVQDRDHLPLEETTLAEAFETAGYATAHMGKWHLGGAPDHRPTDQGYDLNVAGGETGMPPSYFWPYKRDDWHPEPLQELAESGQEGNYLTDRIGREAASFVRDRADGEEPFFLHLAFYSVHIPLEAEEAVKEKYRQKRAAMELSKEEIFGREQGTRVRKVQSHPTYAGMVETMDENVGRVLRALRESGAAENTLVVLTSDNGGLSTAEGPPTANTPLATGKGWRYEGGVRVPLIVRWPGVTEPGSTSDTPVISTDFFPTLMDAAHLDPPTNGPVDGVSLAPVLRRPGADLGREALYWHYPHYSNQGGTPGGVIRKGRWKFVEHFEPNRPNELYDLQADLREQRNLAEERPQKARALRRQLRTWRDSVGAQMPTGANPNYDEEASAP
jgi:arylsulfatase A-like enzyme